MRFSPTMHLLVAAFIGAYLGFLTNLQPNHILMAAFTFAILAIFTPWKIGRAFFLLAFCGTIVSATATLRLNHYRDKILSIPSDECIFEGTINDIIPTLEKGKRATFQVTGIIAHQKRLGLSFTANLFLKEGTAALPLFEGDEIRVLEKAQYLKHALSPGEFDAFWFGMSRQIHANIFVNDPYAIVIVKKNKTPSFFSKLRHRLRRSILSFSTPRQSAVLLALMIGDTHLFEPDQKQIYKNIGAGHLLAVSGLQISFLAYLFYQFFRFIFLLIPFVGRLSRANFFAAWFSLIAVWFFVFLCGSAPSAVRAAAMSSVVLICVIISRHSTIADAFGIAGLFSILLWPACVLDPSFLLSYAAVFGLILVNTSQTKRDALETKTEKSPWQKIHGQLKIIFLTSLAAGLMTLPITAHLFGEITPTGIIINTILVPVAVLLQTPAIFLGMLGVLFNSGQLVRLGADCAGLLEALCEMFDKHLGNLYLISPPSNLATLFFFIAATSSVCLLVYKRRIFSTFILATSLSVAILIDYEWTKGIRITVLPVGQGDATIFEFPSKQVLLIDGGGNFERTFDPGKTIIIPFLKRRGIRQLDVVVLSHPDADHLIGLLSVIEQIPVRELWYKKLPYDNNLLFELLHLAQQKNIQIKSTQDLPPIQHFGNAVVQVLLQKPHLYDKYYPLKTNDSSLVLRVSFEKDSALWPGDLEAEGEKRLLQAYPSLQSTIVKAPHHGSKTSSTLEFVKATQANHVVFCTQDNNMWQFPHSQIVKRWQDDGATTWNTGTQGEITIWLTGHGALVRAYQEENADGKRTSIDSKLLRKN